MKWTPQQQAAIEDDGGTLLVSAAAGSGKTAVLTERAVRLITREDHPVAADRLLIVTFTRAAAEELRGRIAARLADRLAEEPHSAFLRRQRILLGRAPICTVDAFCMQLLKTWFAKLDLPPDFTLADDATAHELREAALAQTMEEFAADEGFRAFADLYGRARTDAAAAAAVLKFYEFSRTLPHPAKVRERVCTDWETREPLAQTAWGKALLREGEKSAGSAKKLILAARAVVAAESTIAKYDAALAVDETECDALLADIRAGRWDAAAVRAANYEPPRLPAVRGAGEEGQRIKDLRAAAKKEFARLSDEIFVCTEVQFEEDRARIAPMLRALSRAVTRFEELFFSAKLREKALEYSDFEHLALKLLCTEDDQKTPEARQIAAQFDAVLVDEYQDTNALQALLYRCLANEDGSNLFFVGDIKQSIYRFRLASPEIFAAAREACAPYQPGGAHPAAITLGENFRSAGSVIHAVNDVFSCLMTRETGDVDYDQNEELREGAPSGYDGGPMEVKVVKLGGNGGVETDAACVAQTIRELVESGFEVREKSGGTRPCGYGDVCVLLRTRAGFPIYEAALSALEVPVYADTGEDYLQSPEVSVVLSLLRVVDNPAQDVYMAAVMLSPVGGFEPDDLARLRAESPDTTLYAALLKSGGEKERALCTLLGELRAMAQTKSPADLCAEIYARTNCYAAAGAMENGAARRENLRRFAAFAAASSQSGAAGLSAFVRYADAAQQTGAGSGAAPVRAPEGRVCIMTVHRSKGLEFPVVILADTQHSFNLRDAAENVLFHPKLGAGLTLRGAGGLYATAPHRAIKLAVTAESVSEEMRVLYVALTRARDKLIVTVPLRDAEKRLTNLAASLAGLGGADPYFVASRRSLGDWLLAAALLHPDGGVLRKAAGAAVLPLRAANGHIRAQIVQPAEQEAQTETAVFVRESAPDEALTQALCENFGQRDPLAALSELPVKLSVSSLSHAEDAPVLSRPAFLYKEGLTAAERGTAQHAFLQFADFDAAARDVPGELARLVDEGYLDAALAGKLPQERIETFFASPLAGRMRAAGQLLREYDFITAVPARFVRELPDKLANTPVLVQGIADAVLVNGSEAEIVDYKTDRGKTPADFLRAYAKQLLLYRAAVEKRLGVTVTKCTIYSFELSQEIDVPLALPQNVKKS